MTSRLALTLLALAPSLAIAQVPTRVLAKPDLEYAEPFTAITGFRELADGRVLVADGREKSLQLIDLTRRNATPVGREGSGPGEWRALSRLYPLPADSTLMPDFANGRYFTITPDGKPGAPMREFQDPQLARASLVGIDGRGRFVFVAARVAATPAEGTAGAADVLRLDRATGRIDTVGTLMQPKGEQSGVTMLNGGMLRAFTNLPFAPQDLVAVAADGRIAVLRAAPYRVEWIGIDGRVTAGPSAASPGIRITDAEKEAFLRSQIRPGSISIRGPAGGAAAPSGGGPPAGGGVRATPGSLDKMTNPEMTWPAVKPPFLAGAASIAPDGRLWVLRTRAHDDAVPSYDVFDATGKVAVRVALPRATRLVGFGKGVLYLARTDEDDLLWLQRHRLP